MTARSGLYVDGGYMYKILTGQRNAPKITQVISEILRLPEEAQMENKTNIAVRVTVNGVTEACELAQQLCVELERAKTLVNDLALSLEKLSVKVDV